MQVVRSVKLDTDEHLAICKTCSSVLKYHTEERITKYGMNDYHFEIVCKVCNSPVVVG